MAIISSYGMLRRRKVVVFLLSSMLFVLSTSFLLLSSFIHLEAVSSSSTPLFGTKTLRNTYPIIFFIPLGVIRGIIVLSCLVSFICLLTIIGTAIHRKRILYLALTLQSFLFIAEVVLLFIMSFDLFDVVNESSLSSYSSATHFFSSSASQAVITASSQNPDEWKTVQDYFKCCGYDFITLYLGNDRENPVNNVPVIHTGSSCDAAVDSKVELILSAFPEYTTQASTQFKTLVEKPNPNYFCKNRALFSSYNFYYFGIAVVVVILSLQIANFYFTRVIAKSKKFKSFRLSALKSGKGKGNGNSALSDISRNSKKEELEKAERNSTMFTFSPAIDTSNTKFITRGSNLSTMAIENTPDPELIPYDRAASSAHTSANMSGGGIATTAKPRSAQYTVGSGLGLGARGSTMSHSSAGTRSQPSKSTLTVNDKFDMEDMKILYGDFHHGGDKRDDSSEHQ